MLHIRQKNSSYTQGFIYNVVVTDGFVGDLSTHPSVVEHPETYEVVDDVIPATAQYNNYTSLPGPIDNTYTATTEDYGKIKRCDGTFNFTLPTAVGHQDSQIIIKNIGDGVITVLPFSGQTIDGEASFEIDTPDARVFASDGENIIII